MTPTPDTRADHARPHTALPARRQQLSLPSAAVGRPPYWLVAALNFTTSSAGTRPRSFTSMPWALAHSRTSVVFSPLAGPGARRGTAAWQYRRLAWQHPRSGQGVPQLLGMSGVQVDLVLRAVQAEKDGSFGGTAVKVVDKRR